jgi:DNA-binding CsgD family transcriptional regulator
MPECLIIGKADERGRGSLALHLCAMPGSVSQVMVRNGRILGFLCELDRHSQSAFGHHVLQSALKLTPMEATVLMSLREHNDPMRVVLHLGLAISTVRTHLKHVFFKTGTTRQSELLRLADRLLSAAPH